jgi:hypothetical protein
MLKKGQDMAGRDEHRSTPIENNWVYPRSSAFFYG